MAKRMFKIEMEYERKSIDEIFKNFIMVKQAEGIAERTIKLYFYEYKHFKKFYDETNDIEQGVIQFFSFKATQAPVTYNMSYKVMNCLFNFAVSQGYMDVNPIKKIGLKANVNDLRKCPKNFLTLALKFNFLGLYF